jgi:hypothetical protein
VAYVGLGPRRVVAAADTTDNNIGNLTSVFDPKVLGITVPWFELYRGVADQVTPGTTATVYVNTYESSANVFGSVAEWDPAQPPLLRPGDSIFFYWSLAEASTPLPVVTLWFRYDADYWTPQ